MTDKLRDLLIAPSDGATIKGDRRSVIEFSWEAVVPSERYRLVVSSDPQLKKKTIELRTAEQKLSVRSLAPGTYYWGVFAEGDPERELFEKPWRVSLKRDVGLRTPDKVTFE